MCELAQSSGSATSVLTLTHSTGSSPMIDIMVSIRSAADETPPALRLAASVVPRASTQQPSYPAAFSRVATSSAFSSPR